MERTRLGRTGLTVSVGCLGTGGRSRLGLGRGAGAEEAADVVRTALDNGIDFVDTAALYGTEEIVGRAVKGRRDSVVISSKVDIVRDRGASETDFVTGREFAERVEQSLRRLDTPYVDVMYLHGVISSQYDYCLSELVPVLHSLRDRGAVRHLGISERFTAEPLHGTLLRAVHDDIFDVIMVGLNLLNQTALRDVLPQAVQKDIGVQCMYAVRGKLASVEDTRVLVEEAIAAGQVDPRDVDRDDPLGFLVDTGAAASAVDACYRFARHAAGIDSVLTGTGSITHLLDNIRSISAPPLPPDALARLSRMFSRVVSLTGQ